VSFFARSWRARAFFVAGAFFETRGTTIGAGVATGADDATRFATGAGGATVVACAVVAGGSTVVACAAVAGGSTVVACAAFAGGVAIDGATGLGSAGGGGTWTIARDAIATDEPGLDSE